MSNGMSFTGQVRFRRRLPSSADIFFYLAAGLIFAGIGFMAASVIVGDGDALTTPLSTLLFGVGMAAMILAVGLASLMT